MKPYGRWFVSSFTYGKTKGQKIMIYSRSNSSSENINIRIKVPWPVRSLAPWWVEDDILTRSFGFNEAHFPSEGPNERRKWFPEQSKVSVFLRFHNQGRKWGNAFNCTDWIKRPALLAGLWTLHLRNMGGGGRFGIRKTSVLKCCISFESSTHQ